MSQRSILLLVSIAALLLAMTPPAFATAKPAPPAAAATPPADKPPENLKVLPKDWSRRQVIEVMKGWTGDLGVRCQHCHVGEEGMPFDKWDFPSDEKETKKRAREMLKLLNEINTRLGAMSNIHDTDGPAPSATCATCHHGVARPRKIEDVFEETRAGKGIAAAISEYRSLRESDLIRGSYDFSIRPLANQARRQLKAQDAPGAQQVMDLAIDVGLDGMMARMTLTDIALAQGQKDLARTQLEKALTLELNPDERGWVQQRLKELEGAAK